MLPLPPSNFFAYLPFVFYELGNPCQPQVNFVATHLTCVPLLAIDFKKKHNIPTFDLCPLQAQVQLEQL